VKLIDVTRFAAGFELDSINIVGLESY